MEQLSKEDKKLLEIELQKLEGKFKRIGNILTNLYLVSFVSLIISVLMFIWFDAYLSTQFLLTSLFLACLFLWLSKAWDKEVEDRIMVYKEMLEPKKTFKERLNDLIEKQDE